MSQVFTGHGVSAGLCKAKSIYLSKKEFDVGNGIAQDIETELATLDNIIKKADEELVALYDDARTRLGEKEAEIFDAHLSILRDVYSVYEPIKDMISAEKMSAAKAIDVHFKSLVELFQSIEDERMSERATDAEDIRNRLLRIASGKEECDISALTEATIIVAEELVPSDTIRMDLDHVAGLVIQKGGVTSHTAIIARTLGIPAVVGIEDSAVYQDGLDLIVDGKCGVVIIDPTEDDIAEFISRKQDEQNSIAETEKYINAKSVTADSVEFELCGNIGTPAESESVVRYGGDGIGLFRSEFLFMDKKDHLPSEEEQFEAYRTVLERLDNRPVTIRTLDIGGDKALPVLELAKEDNPFLGLRAVRLCLKQTELFKTQLRALLRASAFGCLRIMFPMVSGVTELREAKNLLNECRLELEREGYALGQPQVGIMVEIPSAALLADILAKEVDFFSIGTNDLIQYTVAAERGNESVEHLYSPYNPAVLRLIAMTAKAAEDNNILCGMCGEAAGEFSLLPVWAGLGLRELSMSPKRVPLARKKLSEITISDAREKAVVLLRKDSPEAIEELLKTLF